MDQPLPEPAVAPSFQDITLYDQDTGEPFIFTAKEQEFYSRQGFEHVPKRSPQRRRELEATRYKGKPIIKVTCMRCGQVGKITQEPPDPHHVLCETCFNILWEAHLEANPELRPLFEQQPAEQPALTA